jgi:hypothetical protein
MLWHLSFWDWWISSSTHFPINVLFQDEQYTIIYIAISIFGSLVVGTEAGSIDGRAGSHCSSVVTGILLVVVEFELGISCLLHTHSTIWALHRCCLVLSISRKCLTAIYPHWLWTLIFLVSASQTARITGETNGAQLSWLFKLKNHKNILIGDLNV